MKNINITNLFILILLLSTNLFSNENLLVEFAGTYYTFEQQVKPNVGDPLGEHLYDNSHVSFELSSYYKFNNYVAIGLYSRYDFGRRESSVYDRIEDGKAVTKNVLSGRYYEFWLGPSLRLMYKHFFFDFGYALIGLRNDTGRDDLPDINGDTSGSFNIDPSVAYKFDLGASVEVIEKLDLIIKMQWQLRYYNQRGGNDLIDNLHHGTQNISPFIGLRYSF
jgi:hypothetical protein